MVTTGFSERPNKSPFNLKMLVSPERLAFSARIFFSAKPKNLWLMRPSARSFPAKDPIAPAIFWKTDFLPSPSLSGIIPLTVSTMSFIEEIDMVPVRGFSERGLVLALPVSSRPDS